eukprot:scaffold292020_cov27-Tisochrysis_lutea.AAC.1
MEWPLISPTCSTYYNAAISCPDSGSGGSWLKPHILSSGEPFQHGCTVREYKYEYGYGYGYGSL